MYYIEYVPGTIARITTTPPLIPVGGNGDQCQSEDVNVLSRIVGNFNHWVAADNYNNFPDEKLNKLHSFISKQL